MSTLLPFQLHTRPILSFCYQSILWESVREWKKECVWHWLHTPFESIEKGISQTWQTPNEKSLLLHSGLLLLFLCEDFSTCCLKSSTNLFHITDSHSLTSDTRPFEMDSQTKTVVRAQRKIGMHTDERTKESKEEKISNTKNPTE